MKSRTLSKFPRRLRMVWRTLKWGFEDSLHFQMELKTPGLLCVPTGKNQKH
jgi:hypothetical protein